MISISRAYGSQKVTAIQYTASYFIALISLDAKMCFLFLSITQLYIAYLGEKKHEGAALVTASHHDMLSTILGR